MFEDEAAQTQSVVYCALHFDDSKCSAASSAGPTRIARHIAKQRDPHFKLPVARFMKWIHLPKLPGLKKYFFFLTNMVELLLPTGPKGDSHAWYFLYLKGEEFSSTVYKEK